MDLRFADTCLYVDLKALQENYKYLQSRAGNSETAAVVKADSYGLGAIHCTKALMQAGCKHFFVAHLGEAIELRLAYPTINIYVFHGIKNNEVHEFFEHKITPVLNCPEQIEAWQNYAALQQTILPCLIHVDTGMNRLGIKMVDFERIIQDPSCYSNLEILYVISHLACADEAEHFMNARQLGRFQQVRG